MTEKLYTGVVTSTGGGRDGHVVSPLGEIDFDVFPPKDMGGKGGAPNPELLLASAWAACFNGALQLIMKKDGIDVAAHQPEVTAEVNLHKDSEDGGFKLTGRILVEFADAASLDDAEGLIKKADAFCPFSKALRGNFSSEVELA